MALKDILNQILYDKNKWATGTDGVKAWAADDAQAQYAQLDRNTALQIASMDNVQLAAYMKQITAPGPQPVAPGSLAPTNPLPSSLPSAAVGAVTLYPTGYVDPNITNLISAKAQRQQAMNANTTWSNDPEVKQLEVADWQIWVETGQWNTPEQQQLHQQAEAARKYANPAYQSFGPAGPPSQGAENSIFLPAPHADSTTGAFNSPNQVFKYAVAGIIGLTLFGFMRR